jgi:hypothetical protein
MIKMELTETDRKGTSTDATGFWNISMVDVCEYGNLWNALISWEIMNFSKHWVHNEFMTELWVYLSSVSIKTLLLCLNGS